MHKDVDPLTCQKDASEPMGVADITSAGLAEDSVVSDTSIAGEFAKPSQRIEHVAVAPSAETGVKILMKRILKEDMIDRTLVLAVAVYAPADPSMESGVKSVAVPEEDVKR